MADPTTLNPPTQSATATTPATANTPAQPAQPVQQGTVQGTQIPIPIGSGIETLQAIAPPFRTNAPAWYTNGVWGTLGCAVAQPGRYLQTCNEPIWTFTTVVGRQLFQTWWQYGDRLLDRYPSR